MAAEVMLIGGRSGVGKTSVVFEVHSLLCAAGIKHCVIDGDMLDMAYPVQWEDGLAERNLSAIWANYRSLGYPRLIYVNSASVLPDETRKLVDAIGDAPRVVLILLSCTDATARLRLGRREVGSGLDVHLKRSAEMADQLRRGVGGTVRQIPTDDRTVADIAADVVARSGWIRRP